MHPCVSVDDCSSNLNETSLYLEIEFSPPQAQDILGH